MNSHSINRVLWVCAFCFLLLIANTSLVSAVDGWQATYWNNIDLDGAPVLQQLETDQNHNPELKRNWGNSPPWPQVENDFFSARYERLIVLQPGRYRFAAAADDGVRVWVNDVLIIDEWINQVPTTHIGYHDQASATEARIRVEYYDNQHGALLTVTWDKVFGSDTAVTGNLYEPKITAWRGEYFNNRIVAGVPALVRNDETIDFNWGLDTPAVEAMNADGFSVRWTRTLNLPAGTYRFKTETDDGVRLILNGRLAIDQWRNQVFSPHTTDLNHPGGPIEVKMEYYDEIGLAQARLTWEKIGEASGSSGGAGPSGYWQAAYYNNTALASRPAAVRVDAAIDFDWGLDTPVPQYIYREAFSVRWTGALDLPAGDYRFTTTSDDGVRLWVNDKIVIDKWNKQPALTYSADVTLPGGRVPVKMEYYNAEHKAVAKLSWERLDGLMPANQGLVPIGGRAASSGSSGSAAASTSAEEVPQTGAKVQVATLNVRTEASILADVQARVKKGDDLPIIGRNRFNHWIQVELPDKKLGWVSALYVTLPDGVLITDFDVVDNPTTAVEIDPDSASAELTGTINSRLNVIRAEPSYLSERVTTLTVGTEVEPIGRNKFSNWVEITLPDGTTGWVGVLFIDLNAPASSLPLSDE